MYRRSDRLRRQSIAAKVGATARTLSVAIPFTVALTACTYGPPELHVTVANHAPQREDARFAFAVHYAWMRRPTGLSTFPDGGRWRVLAEAAAVYICDTLSLETGRLWTATPPANMRSGFTPWMSEWTRNTVWVSLRGYRTRDRTPDVFERIDYRIDSTGQATVSTEPPPYGPATSRPPQCEDEVLARARAEHVDVIGPPP